MHNMHLLPGVSIQPNLELKTWPKQLLGSLPLVIVLPAVGLSNISLVVGRETGQTSPDKKDKKRNLQKYLFPILKSSYRKCWVTFNQGILIEGEGSVQLTSSLR